VMRDNAASVFASDTQHNTIFSVHMYSVFNSASTVTSYIDTFKNANLPLVVGEFGISLAGQPVDYADIMSYTRTNGVGWMAWSWSGNGSSDAALDMVNGFNANSPTTWGNIVFTGANGLSSTSVQCTCYSGGTQPTSTRTNTPPPGFTPTRTNTPPPGFTPTRTFTPTVGPSLTPTRTFTPTTTGGGGGACTPVTSTVTAPFTWDGAGVFCWQIATVPSYINNWNNISVSINGTNFTNVYVATGGLPAKINGNYYISYNSNVAWGHLEIR